MPLNNSPENFTSWLNYTSWLNTVTDNLFWTYFGLIIPYIAIFMIFRVFGAVKAFATTCFIMLPATSVLYLVGLVGEEAVFASLGLALVSTAVLMFSEER